MRIGLLLLLLLSMISVVFIKFIWVDEPEFWRFGFETGEVVFGLSIGYIAAFMFYVIDIWLPKKDEQKKTNERLAVPLSRLLNNMKTPLVNVYKTYGEESLEFNNMTKEINSDVFSKIDLINDEAPMIIFNQNRKANYGEYLIYHVEKVNEYIERIFKLPIPISIDLIGILDNIENSSYHEIMVTANRVSAFEKNSMQMEGDAIESQTYKYYLLYFELRRYMEKNKIKLTIDNL